MDVDQHTGSVDGRVFSQDLLTSETVIWAGQPVARSRSFGWLLSAGALIVLCLVWCIPAVQFVLIIIRCVHAVPGQPQAQWVIPTLVSAAMFALTLIVPVCMIRFLGPVIKAILVRPDPRATEREHTYYAVTNRRILLLTTLGTRRLQAIPITPTLAVGGGYSTDGVGDVTFATPSSVAGSDRVPGKAGKTDACREIVFSDIAGAASVI